MALGTVTVVKKGVLAPGGQRYAILEVQPTTGANYTANGETMTLAHFGFKRVINFASCEPKNEASAAREFVVDLTSETAPKLIVMDAASAAEVAGSSDQSSFRTRIYAIGK